MTLDIYYIYRMSQSVIQSATIISNLLTVIAFLKVRSLQTHTSNILIYALSVTDFCWGIYRFILNGVPFIFGFGRFPLGEIGCMATVPFNYVYYAGSMILVTISIDRVLLVSLDYSKYQKEVTTLRLKVTISICFLISFVASLIEISLWNFAKRNNTIAANINFNVTCLYPPRRMKWFGLYISVSFFLLPLLMVGIFSAVFFNRLLLRIRSNRQIGNVPSTNAANSNADVRAAERSVNANGGNAYVRKRYIKPAITLAALLAAMSISMLPYCVYLLVVAFSGSFSSSVTYIMYLVLQLNPLLDPLFYAATQKDIREFYRNKLRVIFRALNVCRDP